LSPQEGAPDTCQVLGVNKKGSALECVAWGDLLLHSDEPVVDFGDAVRAVGGLVWVLAAGDAQTGILKRGVDSESRLWLERNVNLKYLIFAPTPTLRCLRVL
jgi:hypothetical protein